MAGLGPKAFSCFRGVCRAAGISRSVGVVAHLHLDHSRGSKKNFVNPPPQLFFVSKDRILKAENKAGTGANTDRRQPIESGGIQYARLQLRCHEPHNRMIFKYNIYL